MGDRGNIVVLQHPNQEKVDRIWLYTHWSGSDLPIILQNALKRKKRWTDESYLTRIIFCEMVKDSVAGDTGFGISTYETDNEHPVFVVDCLKERITCERDGEEENDSWTFEEFVQLDIEKVFGGF